MKKVILVSLSALAGSLLTVSLLGLPIAARAGDGQGGGAERCASQNGDVNADGNVNLSDAVTILSFLFLGRPTELVPLCETQGSSGLPATGQTQCYDCSGQPKQCLDCTGRPRPCGGFTQDFLTLQDSFQRTGCPNDASRFADNGDGTVTDNCTGLMWQKRSADVNNDGQSTFQDSLPWCNALNLCLNLGLAGHDDWRLPNIRELESIVDYGRVNPAIDPVFSAISGRYWSSTSIESNPEGAWLVEFFGGGTRTCVTEPSVIGESCCDKSCEALVRAVRG